MLACWSASLFWLILTAALGGSFWLIHAPFVVGWWRSPNLAYYVSLCRFPRRWCRGAGRILHDWLIGDV